MKGVLGNLQFSVSISFIGNEEGNYLESQRVVPITRQRGMFPVVPSTDVPQKPSCGQLDDRMMTILAEDWRTDDWVLGIGSHW